MSKHTETPSPEMKILCSLTPGGSEFANDPEFCAKYIRERFIFAHETVVKKTIKCRQLEASNKELVEALEKSTNDVRTLCAMLDIADKEPYLRTIDNRELITKAKEIR